MSCQLFGRSNEGLKFCRDIHPNATLTRVYFENMFCILPFSASSSKSIISQRSDIGIKVALGDSSMYSDRQRDLVFFNGCLRWS